LTRVDKRWWRDFDPLSDNDWAQNLMQINEACPIHEELVNKTGYLRSYEISPWHRAVKRLYFPTFQLWVTTQPAIPHNSLASSRRWRGGIIRQAGSVQLQFLMYWETMVPRAGIEPATRGFSA